MPESVKISELPPLSTVQPNDIVPVVDEFLTQTSKATAAQIAAIGGGPPGANTVSTDKIQDNAVTAAKCAFTGPDKLFSRIATGAGSGVEISCTSYARGLLAIGDPANARDYLDALQSTNNPVFSGQVRVGRGNAAQPAIVPDADTATGIFFPDSDAMSIAADGQEVFRFRQDGTLLSRSSNETIMRARFGAVAWVLFDGTLAAGADFPIVTNSGAIAARYGLTIPGAPSAILGVGGSTMQAQAATTRAYMQSVELARGYDLIFEDEGLTVPDQSFFTDKYGKVNYALTQPQNKWPAYALGTETRANFTSPGDDKLWYWTGAAWDKTPASGKGWIGSMTLRSRATGSAIKQARGVAAVSRGSQGTYTITLQEPISTIDYCTVVSASSNAGASVPVSCRIVSQTSSAVTIAFSVANTGTAYDPNIASVAIFR